MILPQTHQMAHGCPAYYIKQAPRQCESLVLRSYEKQADLSQRLR